MNWNRHQLGTTRKATPTMQSELSRPELSRLGWDPAWETALVALGDPSLTPARVVREERERYWFLDALGEGIAECSGRLRHEAAEGALLPAVGDWVALSRHTDGPSVVRHVLPRRTAFVRKVPGMTTEEQIVAANVDTVFLVSGLDGDFNPRRIERYLTAAWESGASPVIVLNKADLADDLEARVEETNAVGMGVPVIPVSALASREDGSTSASPASGEALPQAREALAPWLTLGRTVALLGSSGVGKSTLANALAGEVLQETGAVREGDSRGRHTTTRRQLLALSSGALLIDTPGMRELQLWGEEATLDQTFPEILAFAAECRFRDCTHESEPGCAIQNALETGRLEASRFAAWKKLQRELAHLERRRDVRALLEERAKWKQRSKVGRINMRLKQGPGR